MFVLKQKDDGSAVFEANGGGSETDGEFGVVFDSTSAGVEIAAALGRGVTDTDRTYIRLKRSDGTSVYIYVDTGTTVVCSTTKP
jgi:hypothetical protein